MNDLVREFDGELVDGSQFFAPVSSDLVDSLIGQYRTMRAKLEAFSEQFTSAHLSPVISYFLQGNMDRHDRVPSLDRVFQLTGAVAALNSEYWQRALALTDVYEAMPQKRRDEWNDQIREHKTPDFEEETVRATIGELLLARSNFFAERVDGIFRALSHEHVTNCPEGFGKRMIMYALDSYGYPNSSQCGHLNDLRNVIAKFMGREPIPHYISSKVVKAGLARTGEWVSVDGGALRIRVYKKGTAHLEVHPDMAWRLNCVLASLYPTAIPASFRTKPKKQVKDFVLFDKILSPSVTALLEGMEPAYELVGDDWQRNRRRIPNSLTFRHGSHDKYVLAEAKGVLQAIGGTEVTGKWHFQFDYDPSEVLDEVICSGRIPDHKAHQFYPTPEKLARIAVEMADIGEHHLCLEPSAGIGGIADFMPQSQTRCIEISELNCKVLKAKGFSVEQADFLKYADTLEKSATHFSRVIMNPPYSENRWKLHTERAAELLHSNGVLVAILPATTKGSFELAGFHNEYSPIFSNEFAGTSTSVVILKSTKL